MVFNNDEVKRKFVYKERSIDSAFNRADTKSDKESYIALEGAKWFTLKENHEHCIRPLPPFWPGAEHWGIDVFVHFSIGSGNNAYLCLNKMGKGNCPVCEDLAIITDEKIADKIKLSHRVLQWVIDREDEKAGPLLWSSPRSLDAQIMSVATSKRNRSVLHIDNPDRGHDIVFKTKGSKQSGHMLYEALKCEIEATPISTNPETYNAWLTFVEKNSLPSILKFYNYDHIYQVYHGKPVSSPSEIVTTSTLTHNVDTRTVPSVTTYQGITSPTSVNIPKVDTAISFPYTHEEVLNANTDKLDEMILFVIDNFKENESTFTEMDDSKVKMYLLQRFKLSPKVQTEAEMTPSDKLKLRFKRNVTSN